MSKSLPVDRGAHRCRLAAGLLLAVAASAAGLRAAESNEPAQRASAAAVEAARDAMAGRLGRSPFNWYDPATDGLRRIKVAVPRTSNTSFGWTPPSWLFTWLAWGALAVVLGVIALTLVKAYLARDRSSPREVEPTTSRAAREVTLREALPEPARQGPGDLLAAARQARESGRLDLAIVYLFSHQLLVLDHGHWIAIARGKTNRRYLRELERHPRLAAILRNTMVAFEDVYFGGRALSTSRFDACWSQLAELQRLAAEPAPRSAA